MYTLAYRDNAGRLITLPLQPMTYDEAATMLGKFRPDTRVFKVEMPAARVDDDEDQTSVFYRPR